LVALAIVAILGLVLVASPAGSTPPVAKKVKPPLSHAPNA